MLFITIIIIVGIKGLETENRQPYQPVRRKAIGNPQHMYVHSQDLSYEGPIYRFATTE
jgi:hypothetical protein